jgi:UDP-N-acetylmuramyl tripeptide synthase
LAADGAALTGALPPLFTDSRRLLGPSLWLDAPGAVLDVPAPLGRADALLEGWEIRVRRMATRLGWSRVEPRRRNHASGCTLAFAAPADVLLTATSLNEWALQATASALGVAYDPASLEEDALPVDEQEALIELTRRAALESALVASRSPSADDSPLAPPAFPVALVTGSNGKTTTVRLLAAILRAAGHTVGYSCTDGVFIGDECVLAGDYSGPEGARRVLRDPSVTAAVLETARGGLLRRGLIVPRADAVVITNVAADHFGDYGVDSLADLAAVKGVISRALSPQGALVLNGDDATLRALAPTLRGTVRWFNRDPQDGLLPPLADIPLTLGGSARHNVANAAAAALAAEGLGVPRSTIHAALRAFGSSNTDNAGRLEQFDVRGARVWLDYAHNPHGLAALLETARAHVGSGRLGLLLGQAGDRDDDSIRALARTAWAATPSRLVLNDLGAYLRGRVPGEVPAILQAELRLAGAPAECIALARDEKDGARLLLTWASPGDLLVLPVHALAARDQVRAPLLTAG